MTATVTPIDPGSLPKDPFPRPAVRLAAVRPEQTSKYAGIKDALDVGLPDDGQYVFVADPTPAVSWRSRLARWASRRGVTIKQRRIDGAELDQPAGMGYLLRAIPEDPHAPGRSRTRKRKVRRG